MNGSRLRELSAWEASALLRRRELSAVDLLAACLERVDEREGDIHAFARLDRELAQAQARALDRGPVRGPLHGLPLGVKDIFDTSDLPTSYGSVVYARHQPVADAAAVALCREAGALVMGKTVTTEFAYFEAGPTCNPHHLNHSPGGSSSGSAAAVADFMLPLALGTQTAGSIIRPASYCGIVGYKPSAGRVPRAGVKSSSETLDTVGGFGRTVRDAALLGSVLTGDRRLIDKFDGGAPRIGLFRTPEWSRADSDTNRIWAQAAAALAPDAASVEEASAPKELDNLAALQASVMAFEMARSLSHERLHHGAHLSDRLREQLARGLAIQGEDHAGFLELVQVARRRIDALFDNFDVLLAPSATGEAPLRADGTGDPIFCRGWTLLGLPCVHLPFARGRQGLPLGLQIVGRFAHDHRLMAHAQWVHERLTR